MEVIDNDTLKHWGSYEAVDHGYDARKASPIQQEARLHAMGQLPPVPQLPTPQPTLTPTPPPVPTQALPPVDPSAEAYCQYATQYISPEGNAYNQLLATVPAAASPAYDAPIATWARAHGQLAGPWRLQVWCSTEPPGSEGRTVAEWQGTRSCPPGTVVTTAGCSPIPPGVEPPPAAPPVAEARAVPWGKVALFTGGVLLAAVVAGALAPLPRGRRA